jgi:hypothetical protein
MQAAFNLVGLGNSFCVSAIIAPETLGHRTASCPRSDLTRWKEPRMDNCTNSMSLLPSHFSLLVFLYVVLGLFDDQCHTYEYIRVPELAHPLRRCAVDPCQGESHKSNQKRVCRLTVGVCPHLSGLARHRMLRPKLAPPLSKLVRASDDRLRCISEIPPSHEGSSNILLPRQAPGRSVSQANHQTSILEKGSTNSGQNHPSPPPYSGGAFLYDSNERSSGFSVKPNCLL